MQRFPLYRMGGKWYHAEAPWTRSPGCISKADSPRPKQGQALRARKLNRSPYNWESKRALQQETLTSFSFSSNLFREDRWVHLVVTRWLSQRLWAFTDEILWWVVSSRVIPLLVIGHESSWNYLSMKMIYIIRSQTHLNTYGLKTPTDWISSERTISSVQFQRFVEFKPGHIKVVLVAQHHKSFYGKIIIIYFYFFPR